jgi:hypothetical protein
MLSCGHAGRLPRLRREATGPGQCSRMTPDERAPNRYEPGDLQKSNATLRNARGFVVDGGGSYGSRLSGCKRRIRRLAVGAREWIGSVSELFSGQRGLGPDGDSVALGELLKRLKLA